MEYIGSEHESKENYLIKGAKSIPLLTPQPCEEIQIMENERAPEFIVDQGQGLYYTTANNYYGYYCTGFESPSEWDDRHRFFGLDGPDPNYAGLQTENLPYVYYTPSYGYAQSPYNPYNPYIPGAIVGMDSPSVGMQQYFTGPSSQPNVSSPPYFPLVVQSRPEIIPNSLQDPSLFSTGVSKLNKADGPVSKHNPPSAPAEIFPSPTRPALGNFKPELADTSLNQSRSSFKVSEEAKANVAPNKQLGNSHLASFHGTQGRNAPGSIQAADHFSVERVSSLRNSLKVALPVTNGYSDFGLNSRGWPAVDKLRPRPHYGGVLSIGNGSSDVLGEQNRGPRTSRSRSQWASSFSVNAYTTKAGDIDAAGNIIIHPEQFNKDDFPVKYVDAKFFVIKSYSEDDVHKSIKYNVWSSTPNGNKRLDSAYEDAQRIAAGKTRGCPVFLFFSVNASGQFCGVAEMIGPVNFHKDMDFWQQDKWSGSFPVKWHIIKDVPNSNFRHIILENNENKPVTNSRDTQEIRYKQGSEMLTIFKNYTSKTSMLDDFMFYEERQKIMHEEKARLLSKIYEGSFLIPTSVPPERANDLADVPLKVEEKPAERNDLDSSGRTTVSTTEQEPLKSVAISSSNSTKDNADCKVGQDVNDVTTVLKIGSLTINPKQVEVKPSDETAATVVEPELNHVVTVGSMPVNVLGSLPGILMVGTIPVNPKAPKLDKECVLASDGNPV
ncbi:YTH domain-containing protein ECT4 isoform X1 [Telopea speciosissima]|uniref:YTH domain-containing protein ECT4 isoform X1 n=1 Tax=Telopea speciosissima TaxID=54955 RepID=UPI001CC73ECE|nr:YTH domain-containing protein ECT4 isoform X1 [Telopea speciosissima]XP_043687134.1 YTH domain-containing protein ECT4 isoform X1 [Telopea speciosissima]